MKRLIVTGPRCVEFEDVPPPTCTSSGLVIRARVTAVSAGTEIRVYRAIPVDEEGKFMHERIPFSLPTENGYSMVGEVVEVGAEVSNFAVGDRVFAPCPHKELAAIDASLATKLPDSVSDEQAVFLNILEVAHISLRRGTPQPGENVAVVGQGVIGLSALAYCRAFGFRTAVIDKEPTRLAIAEQMGADLSIAADAENYVETVVDFFDGQGADVVLESASVWPAIRTAMQVARVEGKVVIVSRHTNMPDFNPVGHPFIGKKLTLLTSYGHPSPGNRWDRSRSIALTLDLLSRKKIDLSPMITHRLNCDALPEVYQQLDRSEPEMVGVVLRWNEA